MTELQRFLDRFADFGGAPDPDKYENLFDPVDGTVLHPGMTAPLHRNQVRAYMNTYLAGVPCRSSASRSPSGPSATARSSSRRATAADPAAASGSSGARSTASPCAATVSCAAAPTAIGCPCWRG